MLSDSQISFLQSFQFYQGSIRDALKECNLENNHFRLWMQNDEFYQKYSEIRSEIAQSILSEFRFNYIKMIQNILFHGYRETTINRTTQTNKNGTATIKKSSRHTIKMIPESYIKNLLNYETVESSINNLAQQGMIPRSMARKFLNTAYEYQQKLQGCFGTEERDEKMNDEKAIALIKQALLGSGEEIG